MLIPQPPRASAMSILEAPSASRRLSNSLGMEDNSDDSLVGYLSVIPDPRIERGRRHTLLDIFIIAVCAVICGAEGWTDIEEFGHSKEDLHKEFLVLPCGIPSHDTFRRVFLILDPMLLR